MNKPYYIKTDQIISSDGVLFTGKPASTINYDDSAHRTLFAVEDRSYWFMHRNSVILAAVEASGFGGGLIADVGGGNGYTAKMLQDNGYEVALFEPGEIGARNAKTRGVDNVVCGLFDADTVHSGAAEAVTMFDVIEHIEDDDGFLKSVSKLIAPKGYIFITVPALQCLWSGNDASGGHFRRYSAESLAELIVRSGYEVEFISYFFRFLVAPIWAFRTLPSRFRSNAAANDMENKDENKTAKVEREFIIPAPVRELGMKILSAETKNIAARRSMRLGSSLIAVARKICQANGS
jgi:SAM-dependent methyltransferase